MFRSTFLCFLMVHAQVCALRVFSNASKKEQEVEIGQDIAWVTSFDPQRRIGSFYKSFTQFWPPSLGSLVILAENNEVGRNVVGCVNKYSRSMKRFVNASVVNTKVKSAYLHRQLWKFTVDKYTEAPAVAIFDDDACLFTQVVKRHLVNDGKLINRGLRMSGFGSNGRWASATRYVLGQSQVADFMTDFPVLIHTAMLPEVRGFIINRFKDEANLDMTKSEEEQLSDALDYVSQNHKHQLSEFNLIMNYAWYSPKWKDRYQWHFAPSQDLMEGYEEGKVKAIPAFSFHNHARGCPVKELDVKNTRSYRVYPMNMQMKLPEGSHKIKGVDWLGMFGHSYGGQGKQRFDYLLSEYFTQARDDIYPFLHQVQADIHEMNANKIPLSLQQVNPDAADLLETCL